MKSSLGKTHTVRVRGMGVWGTNQPSRHAVDPLGPEGGTHPGRSSSRLGLAGSPSRTWRHGRSPPITGGGRCGLPARGAALLRGLKRTNRPGQAPTVILPAPPPRLTLRGPMGPAGPRTAGGGCISLMPPSPGPAQIPRHTLGKRRRLNDPIAGACGRARQKNGLRPRAHCR